MRKIFGVLFVLAIFLCGTATVHASTLYFDYQNLGSNILSVDGVTSTATATGGTLSFGSQGYGVTGNNTTEINYDETLNINFDTSVMLETILVTNSDGGNNDLIEMLVDGLSFDFTPDFGNNHPENMTSRSTNDGTNRWILDFTGLDVVGTDFTFQIPAGYQADGTNGSEYTIGAICVAPVPEPSTMLLLGSGLAGIAWCGRRRKKA